MVGGDCISVHWCLVVWRSNSSVCILSYSYITLLFTVLMMHFTVTEIPYRTNQAMAIQLSIEPDVPPNPDRS